MNLNEKYWDSDYIKFSDLTEQEYEDLPISKRAKKCGEGCLANFATTQVLAYLYWCPEDIWVNEVMRRLDMGSQQRDDAMKALLKREFIKYIKQPRETAVGIPNLMYRKYVAVTKKGRKFFEDFYDVWERWRFKQREEIPMAVG